ncbi:hypothetical protein BH747_08595 [Enterococcus villorum]|uniref:Uncharacterized protein n=1 Tax=Enterococcus villorum TaxID=112904 RepID=A0A1V8YUX4_9ENTE|nr:hypothetical protein [Enterococcus villorum]OQO69959.1 hypothetical protein BH747_08595 [Enterococcus villorum]OQO76411.1 hypothetical protein BH744_03105 [Enterococcus villorum]
MNDEMLKELNGRVGKQADKVEELSLGNDNEKEAIPPPTQSKVQILDQVSIEDDEQRSDQEFEEFLHEKLEIDDHMDFLTFYHSNGIESLKKRKQELNKKITEAYKKNSLYEEQTKNDLQQLLTTRQQMTIRNELKSIFGIDVIDFYQNSHTYNDGKNNQSYINMIDQIDKIMKKEQPIEPTNESEKAFKLTNKTKKELQKKYNQWNKCLKNDKYKDRLDPIATDIENLIKEAINNGALQPFEKHHYYNMDQSKTMKKLGLNKWDIKGFLSQRPEPARESASSTSGSFLNYKNESELKELKKEYNELVTIDFIKRGPNSTLFKKNLQNLRETHHELNVVDALKELTGIDMEKFYGKYVFRLGVDPKEQINKLRKEVSNFMKKTDISSPKYFTPQEEQKKDDDKEKIRSIYNQLENFDKKKDWKNVNIYTKNLLKEINATLNNNLELVAENYDYDIIYRKSKTLSKLGISNFSQYLGEEDPTKTYLSTSKISFDDIFKSILGDTVSYDSVASFDSSDRVSYDSVASFDSSDRVSYDSVASFDSSDRVSYDSVASFDFSDRVSYDSVASFDSSDRVSYDSVASFDSSDRVSYDSVASFDSSDAVSYDSVASFDSSDRVSYDSFATFDSSDTVSYDSVASFDSGNTKKITDLYEMRGTVMFETNDAISIAHSSDIGPISNVQIELNDRQFHPVLGSEKEMNAPSLSIQEKTIGEDFTKEMAQSELKPTFAMEIKKKFEEITKQHHVRQTNNELKNPNDKINQQYDSLSKNDHKLVEAINQPTVNNHLNKKSPSINNKELKTNDTADQQSDSDTVALKQEDLSVIHQRKAEKPVPPPKPAHLQTKLKSIQGETSKPFTRCYMVPEQQPSLSQNLQPEKEINQLLSLQSESDKLNFKQKLESLKRMDKLEQRLRKNESNNLGRSI